MAFVGLPWQTNNPFLMKGVVKLKHSEQFSRITRPVFDSQCELFSPPVEVYCKESCLV